MVLGPRPGARACSVESQEKGGTQKLHQKWAPDESKQGAHPGPLRCGTVAWPGLWPAAPAVVIREYQALGEVDNLNVNICLLI